jgi:hypothetical protein
VIQRHESISETGRPYVESSSFLITLEGHSRMNVGKIVGKKVMDACSECDPGYIQTLVQDDSKKGLWRD